MPLSRFLTSFLSPVIRSYNSFSISNISDFIIKLRDSKPNSGCIMGSFDVVSLFLSLPHNLIVENLKEILAQNSTDSIENNRVVTLFQLCLSLNNFKFEDSIYQQICGSPMGSPLSLIADEIVMLKIDKWITTFKHLGIKRWHRYMDDIFCEFEEDKGYLILNTLNSYNPQIKFTMETETEAALPYLDIRILRTEHKFHSTVYYKKGIEPSYLNFNSFGPISHKISIVKTLTKRIIMHCSLPGFKKIEMSNIIRNLQRYGFPASFVMKHTYNGFPIQNRQVYRSNCYLQYSPTNQRLAEVLKKFGIRPIFVGSRSIGQIVRHPITKSLVKTEPSDQQNAVYSLSCQQCTASYVGETGRTVGTRVKEHIRNDCTMLEQRAVIRFLNAEGIQTSQICQRMKKIYGFEVLEHPAYSPDLAPSDYFRFGLLKKELKGK
ncbi:hypothetical protein LAZ67_6002304 [Cordylochernes scorpioides]|uniref:Reverse transcriptase domain-containing protein n=1 Tax=Cordylochernes scorpioides TaxID=51811 RepID=A0ABY6KJQ4_9ARAC|nr:hypothetical protein LAZ67_6002304 [Cordylochernes scorpioides]